jgi:hypothetical protein
LRGCRGYRGKRRNRFTQRAQRNAEGKKKKQKKVCGAMLPPWEACPLFFLFLPSAFSA